MYPPEQRARGERSHVVVMLTIDATGAVEDAVVAASGGEAFDAAALAAARELVFAPATRDGSAIASKIPFAFDFAVEPDAPVAPAPSPLPAPAPAPALPLPPPELDIDVKGDRPPAEVTRRVMDAQEIERMPGTNGDALHAIENMPGVAQGSGISGDIVVRGSAPEDTGVFVDGTWIPEAFHFGGITSVIPTELLSRVDFYPGNFSAEYGRQMGGIVDLGIRSPRKDRLGALLQLDLLDGRTVVEGPIGSTTRILLAARRSWVDAWLGPVLRSAGNSDVAAPVYYDYQAMIEQDIGSATTARLLLFGSDDRFALVVDSPAASDPVGGDLGIRYDFYRVQARTETRASDRVRWVNTAAWGQNFQHFTQGDDAFSFTFGLLNVQSKLRLALARGAILTAGIDYFGGEYDVTIDAPPQPPSGVTSGPSFAASKVHLHGSGFASRPGVFLASDVSPVDRVKILPGVRIDYAQDTAQWTYDPRLAVRVDLVKDGPRTTLKGGIGIFHQPPDPGQSIQPFGTPGVEAEVARHESLGIEQELAEDVDLSIEGFHKDLRHLVVSSPGPSASGDVYVNTGSGRVWGAEVLLKWRAAHGPFFGWLAYTLSRSERRDDASQPYRLFDFDQTHVVDVIGSYRLGRGWTAGLRWRYATGNPYTPYTGGVADFDAGAFAPIASPHLNSARLGAFHSLDLRIDKTWTFPAWKLTAYVDVRNVYNRQNPESQVYNFDYSKSSPLSGLPILPILGARGEL